MRIALPLATGLVLALAATSVSAADADLRRSGRSDLLRSGDRTQRVERIDAPSLGADTGTVQGVLNARRAPTLPRTSLPVTHDLDAVSSVNVVSIMESLSLRQQRSAAHVHHAVKLTDDPAFQTALENRRQATGYVILAIDASGRETLIRP